MTDKEILVVYPGTFDPMTNGHLDVINRGRRLFDRLIVAIGENPEKSPMFAADERAAMIRELTSGWSNVTVEAFSGLTVDYAKRCGAAAILRGIRSTVDLPHELQAAYTNRIVSNVETVFILTTEEHALTSSSLIKQIASLGGDVSKLVPPLVMDRLRKRMKIPG